MIFIYINKRPGNPFFKFQERLFYNEQMNIHITPVELSTMQHAHNDKSNANDKVRTYKKYPCHI